MQRAATAQERGDFEQARNLYIQALQEEDLSRKLQIRAWKGLARSALQNKEPELARNSLKQWRLLAPQAPETWAWQKVRSGLIRTERGEEAYASYLFDLLDPGRGWSLVFQAGRALTGFHIETGEYQKALETLSRLEELAETEEQFRRVEDLLQGIIPDIPQQERAQALEAAAPEEAAAFPYTLLRWNQALDRFQKGETDWNEAWNALTEVLTDADPFLRSRLKKKLRKLEEEHGRPVQGIALLLPLSGGYGDIGWKIVRGADAAQWRLTREGRPLRLRIINTQESEWLDRLEKLPPSYSVVGGPIRSRSWEKIHQAGLHKEFAFFTFRSSLNRGTEGEDAYRFFPGRKDQVNALLQVCRETLDLSSYGALYPKSSFGRSMSRAFWNATVERDAELKGLDYYNPQQIVSYEDKVSDFLRAPEDFAEKERQQARNSTAAARNATRNATLVPEPDFKAVFIPDSFSRARILIPEFFYFNQPDLVFLGPAMWGQEIKRISGLDMRYFRLTLLASPWWPDNSGRQQELLRRALERSVQEPPDFWVGLGHDFVRFAAELDPVARGGGDKQDLSRKLSSMNNFEWTLAPISWNKQGKARQDLFVLRPASDGVKRVRPEKLRTRLEKAREAKRKRLHALGAKNATTGEANRTLPSSEVLPQGERN
ncbi:MAG: hypothetical protein K9K39_03900 [Desulfohalobiaceae bacterium]|nr:hypothetical protein [Desulfohalobiaceae bacterium]